MTTILNLTGKVVRAGSICATDGEEFLGQPRVEILLPDGRTVTIIGLIRDEARAFAEFLYHDPVWITCGSET